MVCKMIYLLIHLMVVVLLYPHVFSECSVLTTDEIFEEEPAAICWGVHAVHIYSSYLIFPLLFQV